MKIIHLAACHHLNTNIPIDLFNRVVQSQFAIAKIIQQNPYCPVVCESMDKDTKYDELEDDDGLASRDQSITVLEMRQTFPLGLPDNYADLNTKQRKTLYAFGASITLLFLNIIPVLYKSADEITALYTRNFAENDFQKALDSGIADADWISKSSLLQPIRESNALNMCRQAAQTHFKNADASSSVILVYGGGHNFKPLCDKNDISCRKIFTYPVNANYPFTYEEIYTGDAPFWLPTEICTASELSINPNVSQLKSSGHSKYEPKLFQHSPASDKALDNESSCCTIS